jgi:carbon monoxide dehydrogenase subunit G
VKVRLDRTFAMPASPDVTWALLQDIEAVAACMPGAAITERIDAQHYKGTVALKIGPASLKFKGDIEVKELDAATRTLRLVAKGTDTSGSSAAAMDLTARVEASDGGLSSLVGHSEASVSGKVAAFASRMMDAVADQILKQFAANFAARVEAQQAAAPQAPAPAAAPPHRELNGLALLWAVLKDWLRGLFSKKTA